MDRMRSSYEKLMKRLKLQKKEVDLFALYASGFKTGYNQRKREEE